MKKNSQIMSLYFYMSPIITLFSIFIPRFYFQFLFLFGLIVGGIYINKSSRYNLLSVIVFVLLLIFILLNVITSHEYQYVIPDGINLLVYSFLPIYIFSTGLFDFDYFISLLYRGAKYLTILLPVFYYLRIENLISYLDFGIVYHLSFISILIYRNTIGESTLMNQILLILNLVMGLIYGSRALILASFICYSISIFIDNKQRSIRSILKKVIFLLSSILVFLNLEDLLNIIIIVLDTFNIKSRNISLLSLQLSDIGSEVILSGRENIYPFVINHIKDNPILPSGLGITRIITNNSFYHSHNFFFELFLILGVPIAMVFLIYFIYKFIIAYKYTEKNIFYLLIIFFVSFMTRSLFNTPFITDQMFFLIIGILLSLKYWFVPKEVSIN